ncbi:hypothetical protein [Aliamphritea spongicola]|nr:hypothetical protein [Aliamphritea spongicola]
MEKPEENGTTLGVRHEADLFSYAEFCQMDRGSEDEDDLDQAESIANDIDKMSVTQDSTPVASRIKFDLDLPSAEEDDIPWVMVSVIRNGIISGRYCCRIIAVSFRCKAVMLRPVIYRLIYRQPPGVCAASLKC